VFFMACFFRPQYPSLGLELSHSQLVVDELSPTPLQASVICAVDAAQNLNWYALYMSQGCTRSKSCIRCAA
jgi:hypothetical protein